MNTNEISQITDSKEECIMGSNRDVSVLDDRRVKDAEWKGSITQCLRSIKDDITEIKTDMKDMKASQAKEHDSIIELSSNNTFNQSALLTLRERVEKTEQDVDKKLKDCKSECKENTKDNTKNTVNRIELWAYRVILPIVGGAFVWVFLTFVINPVQNHMQAADKVPTAKVEQKK